MRSNRSWKRKPGGPRCNCGIWLIVALLAASCGSARALTVENVRFWTAPDHTRVVMDLSGPARYEVKTYTAPRRIAVNVAGAVFKRTAPIAVADGVLLRIRRNALSTKAQLVLDLGEDLDYRHFALKAESGRPDRIVVDVYRPRDDAAATSTQAARTAPEAGEPVSNGCVYRIVIDPGHGGMDPGAIREGIREKDVVLDISRKLLRLFDDRDDLEAVLTRTDDYFVSLGDRVRIAKKHEGDLFLSIHANTHPRSSISGMEVYLLSLKGATDREARELADKENASDLVGLAPDERVDDDVLSILMDLHMSRVMSNSSRLADSLLGEARRGGQVTAKSVKQAGLRVLHSLAMPSALVEVAYLSNGRDRRMLSTSSGQQDLAEMIYGGVLDYLDLERPARLPAVASWKREYKVRRGDTLWDLARVNKTTIRDIRERNKLKSDALRIGQKLILP